MGNEWFATWFDTHYYHLLYRNRNEVEARQFIDALLRFLKPVEGARFVDVACGKGRHSRYLHEQGYMVTGLDLSANSIQCAKEAVIGKTGITFFEHDIRQAFPVSDQDVTVNLFTSFGYFKQDHEHLEALRNFHRCLHKGGRCVIDFLNVHQVLANLKHEEHKTVDSVNFSIQRYLEEGQIVKSINVVDGDQNYHYEERVRAFTKEDLCALLEQVGFSILHTFGDYKLSTFETGSDRVIIIAKKNA